MAIWCLILWGVWGIHIPGSQVFTSKLLQSVDWKSPSFNWVPVGPEGGHVERVSSNTADPSQKIAISFYLWTDLTGTGWMAFPELGRVLDGHYTQPQKAVVASENALLYSNDGGFSWFPVLTYTMFQAISESPGSTLYLVADQTVYRSDDGGATWNTVAPLLYDVQELDIDPQNPETVFAAATLSGAVILMRSTDGGSTWSWVIPPTSGLGLTDIMDIEVNPWDPTEVIISGSGDGPGMLYISHDSGTTWDTLMGSLSSGLYFATDVEYRSADTLLVTNLIPRGLYLGVRNGTDWTFSLLDSTGYPIDVDQANDGSLVMATTSGILQSPGIGQPFTWHNDGLRNVMVYWEGQMPAWSGDRFVVPSSFLGGVLYRTLDGGQTWERLILGSMIFMSAVEIAPGDSNILYLSGMGADINGPQPTLHTLYRSSDFGTTWQPLDSLGIDDTTASGATDLHVSPLDPADLLALKDQGLFHSTDAGSTWTLVLPPPIFPTLPGISQHLWIYQGGSFLFTPDHGTSWDTVASWPSEPQSMDVDPSSSTLFFVAPDTGYPNPLKLFSIDTTGTIQVVKDLSDALIAFVDVAPGGGLYLTQFTMSASLFGRSADYGQTWEWDTLSFLAFWIRGSTSQVLLSSIGLGFWRSEDAVVQVMEPVTGSSSIPRLQILNPLTSSVLRLSYTSTYEGPVRLRVFNVAGALVYETMEYKNQPRWTFSLDARPFVSGLYILELQDRQGIARRARWIRIP